MQLKKSLTFWRNWSAKLPLIFVFLALIGLVFFLRSDFWAITKVDCRFEENSCPVELMVDLNRTLIGKNLLFLINKKINQQIQALSNIYKEIQVVKKLPNQIQIILKKRQPLVGLVFQEKIYLVDDQGVCSQITEKTDLPTILVPENPNLKVGEKIQDEKILKTILLIKELQLNFLVPKTVKINVYNLEVEFVEGTIIVFSVFKDINLQINSLLLILSRSKIEGKTINRLDLRFDKPVIIYD